MIENDLSGVKIEDTLFDARKGIVVVVIDNNSMFTSSGEIYPIKTSEYDCFLANGKYVRTDKHPSLFKSIDHLIKYFTEVKNSEINKQGEISEKES